MTTADPPGDGTQVPAEPGDDPGTVLPTPAKRRAKRPFWQELPLLLVLSLGLAVLIKTFVVQAYYIPSGSMEETLHGCSGCANNDRVLVNKVSYRFRDIRRGEIVVFRGPESWKPEVSQRRPADGLVKRLLRPVARALGAAPPGEKDFIKRVIGLPGDSVACCTDGHVTVNGQPLDESDYVFEDNQLAFGPVQLGPGEMWVMGDHRGASLDSRAPGQGAVPTDNVIGRAFLIVWPVGHWGRLPVPDTFSTLALGGVTSPASLGLATALPVVVVRRRRRLRAA